MGEGRRTLSHPKAQPRGLNKSVVSPRSSNHHNTWSQVEYYYSNLPFNLHYHVQISIKKIFSWPWWLLHSLPIHMTVIEITSQSNTIDCFLCIVARVHETWLKEWREGCFFLWSYKILGCVCGNNKTYFVNVLSNSKGI